MGRTKFVRRSLSALSTELEEQGYPACPTTVARGASCQIIYLEVRPSNVAARHLYRAMGFQQIAIRPEYYPALAGREDALFLGLSL